jgi:hypothetical protein
MALAEKWVSSAENPVTPVVGKCFDRIQVINDTLFHTLTVETGHTDDGLAVANSISDAATSIAPGLYEGRWTAVIIHSGLIRVYEGK